MNLRAAAIHPLMAIVGCGSSSKVFEYFLFDTTARVGNRYPLAPVIDPVPKSFLEGGTPLL